MFLDDHRYRELRDRFLRVRGGVSPKSSAVYVEYWFSPRTRRCFQPVRSLQGRDLVFSAYAEVFPRLVRLFQRGPSFLRVRGGVSGLLVDRIKILSFSPRTRRCFSIPNYLFWMGKVFSAYAEVFLIAAPSQAEDTCFLRVRGGVSMPPVRPP